MACGVPSTATNPAARCCLSGKTELKSSATQGHKYRRKYFRKQVFNRV